MNRLNWTYLDDYGKSHHVVLMHGARSGHLLIVCNAKIAIIDFKVLQSKTYSLFIEDELCEISVERKDNQFLYGFDINKDVDTPRNRERKKRDKKHIFQSILFFGGIVFGALAFMYFMMFRTHYPPADIDEILTYSRSAGTTVSSHGKVFLKDDKIVYDYIVNDKVVSFEETLDTKEILQKIAQNGFPLKNGDEFELEYVKNRRGVQKIYYDQPTKHQKTIYQQMAIQKEWKTHSTTIDSTLAVCRTQIAYELKGLLGWADLYNQDTPQSQNPISNELTYKRLVRDIPFQKKADKNCHQ